MRVIKGSFWKLINDLDTAFFFILETGSLANNLTIQCIKLKSGAGKLSKYLTTENYSLSLL